MPLDSITILEHARQPGACSTSGQVDVVTDLILTSYSRSLGVRESTKLAFGLLSVRCDLERQGEEQKLLDALLGVNSLLHCLQFIVVWLVNIAIY